MFDAGLAVRAFFTTRAGGVSQAPFDSLNLATHVGDVASAVANNRSRVAALAGAPISYLTAEHGASVARVDRPGDIPGPADVLVTTVAGVALAAIAADCVPLLMHDAATGAVVAAHVGRLGLYSGAVDAAVTALDDVRAARAGRGGVSASVGPAICGRCYEVPAALQRTVAARHPSAATTTRWGTPGLDIRGAVVTRLRELGVVTITVSHACTYEDAALFSYRRDGATGRLAGVIVCDGVSLPDGVTAEP